jgi:spoIIIJ-associated protein
MASKNRDTKLEKTAKEVTENLLRLLGVEAEVSVRFDQILKIEVNGPELGLLIGYRGENLESLQLVLGLMINKKLDNPDWTPVNIDIGGWRSQREESLKGLLSKYVSRLSPEQPSIELPSMPPSQRRSIHLLVEEYGDLESTSEGEEPNRRVVVKRKS